MVTASRCAVASALSALVVLALPVVADAKPADVNIIEMPAVRIDPERNTVRLDPSSNTVQLESNAVRPEASAVTAIMQHASLASGTNGCSSKIFELPADRPFVLDTVSVDFSGVRASHGPRASIRVSLKTDDDDPVVVDLAIPLDHESGFSTSAGTSHFGFLVEPNTFDAAVPGDIYQVATCLNRGSAPTSSFAVALLTGTPAG